MSTDLIVSNTDLATTIASYVEQAQDLLAQAERAEITTQEEAGRGADFLKIVGGCAKRSEDWRKGLIDPYSRRIKVINTEVKKISGPLTQAKDIANQKVLDFALAEQKREAAERRAAEETAAQEALEAAQKAEAGGAPAVADQILELAGDAVAEPVKPQTARGGLTGAASSVRMTWTAEVTSLKTLCNAIANGMLPPDLITVSQAELNKLAREWHETTPETEEFQAHGIRAYAKAGLATR